ncbi:SERTA domain-containing protein 2 [Coregonus clupeaformis]|uniref:SERTA domain-containing protein 2 n=1 Tax=Coregonus clupeaformis TaxID=59861 RepID=UPI001BE05943|nr:SERTA domain-containing protein 2 [Coregonus clupeaformis]
MGQRDIVSYETVRRKSGIRTASMCRLDVESAVKGPEQHGNDLPSSRYMVGRGVKRKLRVCEDLMLDLPYPQQRQLVLDLCLDKLQSYQRQAEPSLHRSVLLANTLRQIKQEMRQEGGPHPLDSPPPAPSLPRVPSDCPSTLVTALSSPSLLCEDDAESACTGLPERRGSEDDRKLPVLLFGSFEITNSTSYLTDLQLDDIFEDIDTSMYDPSDFSVLACPPPSGSSRASLGNDDNLKGFSTCTSSSITLQRCLNDLNDLDHIMEILVRS